LRETYDVLRSLGHTDSDSRRLIDAALAKKKKYKTVEELIQAIYQQERGDAGKAEG
jgi:Holliday junction DNA helicase RuvA